VISKTILIADDDPAIRHLLSLMLSSSGYHVLVAENGYQLIQLAQDEMPDLLLVDLMMPHLDGYEAIRQLRNDTRTAHIPMIILTAKSTPNDVVTGFESGADDFISKPFNSAELLARIKGHLRRAAQRPVHNPLTGLAGNILLTEEIRYRIKRDEPFALLYVDLNNFKAFNDTYGFARGDQVLRLVADVLLDAVTALRGERDFIGHIGGDDFAILTTPDRVDLLCGTIIDRFDTRVRQLYDEADLARGYLSGIDRHGVARRFPITSLAIGGVTNRTRSFEAAEEVSRIAAEMKAYAKTFPGSAYAIDVRSGDTPPGDQERRGSTAATVLILSADAQRSDLLMARMRAEGLRAWAAPSLLDAHGLLARGQQPNVIITDFALDGALDAFVQSFPLPADPPLLLLLTAAPELSASDLSSGVSAFFRLPLDEDEVVRALHRLISSKNVLQ
jgi:DNA-binding response OmpR family regulator